ncbi:MAG: hypothetical protein ACJ77B_02960 [Chloroflexota bacterium]
MTIRGKGTPVRLLVVAAAVAVGLLVAVSARSEKPSPTKLLRVVVAGRATVVARPRGVKCRARCVWRFSHGTKLTLRVRPQRGVRFLGWEGDCKGRRCNVVLNRPLTVYARFAQQGDRGLQAWNFHTSCRPTRTTLATILGTQTNPNGGATEAGGGFPVHLRGESQQHLLNPPCALNGNGTLVELDGVETADNSSPQGDGDVTTYLTDPTLHPQDPHLNRIHVELDGTWLSAGIAFPWLPQRGTRVDVQGFLFWDPGHVADAYHDYSGWELHAVAAWLPAMPGARPR